MSDPTFEYDIWPTGRYIIDLRYGRVNAADLPIVLREVARTLADSLIAQGNTGETVLDRLTRDLEQVVCDHLGLSLSED